jgi:hypothetical protein
MKMKTIAVIALLFGALFAGAMFESEIPLVSDRSAVAGPKCDRCQ